jgi:nuclear pore complex protein Nup98-Nup96
MFGGGGSLFGSQQQPQQQQPSLVASVDQNAYGNNPLFTSTLSAAPQATPLNASDKFKPSLSLPVRGTPKSSSKITRLRGFATPTSVPPVGMSPSASVMGGFGARSSTPGSPAGRVGSPMQMLPGLSNEGSILSPNAFVSRPSMKKLDRNRLMSESPSIAAESPGTARDSPANRKVHFDPVLELSAQERPTTPFSVRIREAQQQTTPTRKVSEPAEAAGAGATSAAAANGLSTRTQVKEGDYFTRPSLDILRTMSPSELRSLPDFVVCRKGHGQVEFNKPVDLTTVPSVDDVPGDIVVIEDRACTVYGGEWEETKPPVGKGLNVPATVTLEKCWPLDKATREPIKDPNHPRLKQHLKKLKNMHDTSFVDYDPVKGSWTFKVEHFSRYGLDDSDEDEDGDKGADEGEEGMVVSEARRRRHHRVSDASASEDGDAPPRKSLMSHDEDNDDDYDEEMMESDDVSVVSSTVDVYGTERQRISRRGTSADYDEAYDEESDGTSRASTPRAVRRHVARETASAAATRESSVGAARSGSVLPRTLGLDPKRVAVMQTSFFHQSQPRAKQQPPSSSFTIASSAPAPAHTTVAARQQPPLHVRGDRFVSVSLA